MTVKTLPAAWASAIINLDYSGLEKDEVSEINTTLLDEGLSFTDCLTVGDEYTGRFHGQVRAVADYVFKERRL